MNIETKDEVVKQVIKKLDSRSSVGYKKYGVTLHDDSPSLYKWLNHLQEELLDAANYIQKLQNESSDLLEEKLLKDYIEDIDVQANPLTSSYKRSIYPGDVWVSTDTVT